MNYRVVARVGGEFVSTLGSTRVQKYYVDYLASDSVIQDTSWALDYKLISVPGLGSTSYPTGDSTATIVNLMKADTLLTNNVLASSSFYVKAPQVSDLIVSTGATINHVSGTQFDYSVGVRNNYKGFQNKEISFCVMFEGEVIDVFTETLTMGAYHYRNIGRTIDYPSFIPGYNTLEVTIDVNDVLLEASEENNTRNGNFFYTRDVDITNEINSVEFVSSGVTEGKWDVWETSNQYKVNFEENASNDGIDAFYTNLSFAYNSSADAEQPPFGQSEQVQYRGILHTQAQGLTYNYRNAEAYFNVPIANECASDKTIFRVILQTQVDSDFQLHNNLSSHEPPSVWSTLSESETNYFDLDNMALSEKYEIIHDHSKCQVKPTYFNTLTAVVENSDNVRGIGVTIVSDSVPEEYIVYYTTESNYDAGLDLASWDKDTIGGLNEEGKYKDSSLHVFLSAVEPSTRYVVAVAGVVNGVLMSATSVDETVTYSEVILVETDAICDVAALDLSAEVTTTTAKLTWENLGNYEAKSFQVTTDAGLTEVCLVLK